MLLAGDLGPRLTVYLDSVAREGAETSGPSGATARMLGKGATSHRREDEDDEDDRHYAGEGIVGDDEFD